MHVSNKAKTVQTHLTLCDPMDYIVHGILQARILERVAFPFSRGSSQPRDRTRVLLQWRQILYQLSYQLLDFKNIYYRAELTTLNTYIDYKMCLNFRNIKT